MDIFKIIRKSVADFTAIQQISWENTSLNSDFYFNTMTKDTIMEKICYAVCNNYKAETLIKLSDF